ncbi:MAG: TetR family transcriptional regulator, partial [Polyangiaceae bacterium]
MPTLRERKKARTREALVEAAQRLFVKQGYDSTTVDEIAAEAEVSRRTFFRYFPTKEAVVFPDNAERLERFRQLLRAVEPGESPFASVRRACLGIAHEL